MYFAIAPLSTSSRVIELLRVTILSGRDAEQKSLFHFLEISRFCLLWSKNTPLSITQSEMSNAVLHADVIALVTVLNWLGYDKKNSSRNKLWIWD